MFKFTVIYLASISLYHLLLKHLRKQRKRKNSLSAQRPLVPESHLTLTEGEAAETDDVDTNSRESESKYAFKSRWKLLPWTAGNWNKFSPRSLQGSAAAQEKTIRSLKIIQTKNLVSAMLLPRGIMAKKNPIGV